MQIITAAIQKGGTGKTTTAAALAQAAASKGKKVLALDLDPQGNLSYALGAKISGAGSFALLSGTPAEKLIQRSPQGLDIIPASWALATITSSKGSARRLQEALAPISGRYDFVFIDTPPTAGELQYNALQAATGLIIPIEADAFGLQALYQICDTAGQIQKSNPLLKILGFILTQHNARSTIARQMQETITQKARALGVPFLGAVRGAVAVKEAAALQRSLYDYAPRSKPAADYMEIFTKINRKKR